MITNAVAAARSADVVIYVGGISPQLEGEEMRVNYEGFRRWRPDADRIAGPATEVAQGFAGDRETRCVRELQRQRDCDAVGGGEPARDTAGLVSGRAGGRAVAEVLFGDTNPSGRLPITFYRSTEDLPSFEDYSMTNRTYRYFGGKPQFAFGHGLSYTKFDYRDAKLDKTEVGTNATLELTFNLSKHRRA